MKKGSPLRRLPTLSQGCDRNETGHRGCYGMDPEAMNPKGGSDWCMGNMDAALTEKAKGKVMEVMNDGGETKMEKMKGKVYEDKEEAAMAKERLRQEPGADLDDDGAAGIPMGRENLERGLVVHPASGGGGEDDEEEFVLEEEDDGTALPTQWLRWRGSILDVL